VDDEGEDTMRHCAGWAAGLILLAAGCALDAVRGSGTVATETRDVSDFTAVTLSGSGRLIVEPGAAESLEITADDNLLPLLTSEVKGGRLHLGVQRGTSIRPSKEIVYRVMVKSLEEVDLSGSGSVELKDVKGKRLKVGLSGSGGLTAAGEVERLDLHISGSGKAKTENLKAKEVTVSISGSGGVGVAAGEALNVTVSGSGSVEYVGDPKVTQRISGSGSVRKR
jgi:hypothetical protein